MGRTIKSLSFDARKADRAKSNQKFKSSQTAERDFARALKKVARNAGHIVEAHATGASLRDAEKMMRDLRAYAELIGPWATRQSEKMLEKVMKSNARAYKNQSKLIGTALRVGVGERDTGMAAEVLLYEQVELIKSLPIEAGLRAQKIAAENFYNGTRAVPDQSVIDDLVTQMGMSTEVAVNRAKLIARTETARANASFVQARAAALGVTQYIWRTTMDGAERNAHAKMNNKVVDYDSPPHLSDGTTGHAGTFPNCRCWQDPILPD